MFNGFAKTFDSTFFATLSFLLFNIVQASFLRPETRLKLKAYVKIGNKGLLFL
jgi:hypothetical protein